MIANFFQNLIENKVEYLLISGQATVLYGAATFSEDIDLWIKPTGANCNRLVEALRIRKARYYKLTPQLIVENLERGHGFHFLLPDDPRPDVFLDVMGKPPRVGAFETCLGSAQWMDSEWGRLRTIGIKSLVELKKTQRLEDYPIISKLALAQIERGGSAATEEEAGWAIENIFTLPELRMFFEAHPEAVSSLPKRWVQQSDLGRQWLTNGDADESLESRVAQVMQQRIAELQQADRGYWKPIISDLKAVRAAGKLAVEGALV